MNGESNNEKGGICTQKYPGYLLFEDGSMQHIQREKITPPPDDPYERAKMIDRYWQAKLKLAVEQFVNFKADILGGVNLALKQSYVPVPPDREASLSTLKALQAKCIRYNEAAKKATAAVVAAKPSQMLAREQANAASRLANEELADAVKRIEI